VRYSSLKHSGWHVLTRDHSVTCHPHIYHIWREPSCLYSSAVEHHRTLAGTHFPSRTGWELVVVYGYKHSGELRIWEGVCQVVLGTEMPSAVQGKAPAGNLGMNGGQKYHVGYNSKAQETGDHLQIIPQSCTLKESKMTVLYSGGRCVGGSSKCNEPPRIHHRNMHVCSVWVPMIQLHGQQSRTATTGP